MYSTLKKISSLTIAVAAVGVLGTIMAYLCLEQLPLLTFLDRLSLYFCIIPMVIIAVAHSVALWKTQSELNMETEDQLKKLADLKKKVDELEKKVAYLEQIK